MSDLTPEVVARRRAVVQAGLRHDGPALHAALQDPSAHVRASAVVGLARNGELTPELVQQVAADADPVVRRELARRCAEHRQVPVLPLLQDADERVVEMAAWACGEREQVDADVLLTLHQIASDHADALCREAAVAAMGAIGQPESLPILLTATGDKATVRRRAILALAPYDSPEVTTALEKALEDRDWQVRQAAEDLLSP